MAVSTSIYNFFTQRWWGSSEGGQPGVDAVGAYPPKGSVVAIGGCPQAATLSFNHMQRCDKKHFGMKHVSGDSVVLSVVGSSGCPQVAAAASRELMGRAKDMLQNEIQSRIAGSFMDGLHIKDDEEAVSGGASASFVFVNKQELQLVTTTCGSKSIIVKSRKDTEEVFTLGHNLGDGASLQMQTFPIGSGTAVQSSMEWHRLKEDWEWVLMGSMAFWSLLTTTEAAKIVSSQAQRGADPARILRALAYEASLRDATGATAQDIALSLARLDPAPEPSFATSPRISANRRVSAPGEDAAGIWQMAQTSQSVSPADRAAASPPATDANDSEADLPPADAEEQCSSGEESADEAVSGELTAKPVFMNTMHAHEHSAAGQCAGRGPEDRGCGGEGRDTGMGDARRQGSGASVASVHEGAADACIFIQRVPSLHAVVPADGLAAAVPLAGCVQLDPRRTVDSACSREFGAGAWWRVDVDLDVEVPEDDGFRVAGGRDAAARAAADCAGMGAAGSQRPRRRGLRRAARCAVAGMVVIASTLLLRRRRNRK